MKLIVIALGLAALLGACGGAGSGGAAPRNATTTGPAASAVPAVAGTEAPKDYNTGKTAAPSSSPEGYTGY